MTDSTDFPQDIYARNLLSHRGYPLWSPEPSIELPGAYQLEGLKLGDVGVVTPQEGSFDVFFNITLPREHPLHMADGVPDNFAQVELRREDYKIVPHAEDPGHIISSRGVRCAVHCTDPHYIDGKAYRLTDHRFDLHRNEGAMLILPQGAECHRLAKESLLLDVVIKNAVDWYRFAREQLYRNIDSDALYLITGFHKTRSWAIASFKDPGESSAHCGIVQLGREGSMLVGHSTWETVYPFECRIGPRSDVTGIPNQCIFITGFKIAINKELLHLKRVTVKTEHSKRTLASGLVGLGASLANLFLAPTFDVGHSSETSSQGEANESTLEYDSAKHDDEGIIVERVPQWLQPFHPSNIINCYMLKKEPSAQIAVTHDSQWINLLEKGVLKLEDMLREGYLEAVVSQEYNTIMRDGAVYLQKINEPTDADASAVSYVCDANPPVSQQASTPASRFFLSSSRSEDEEDPPKGMAEESQRLQEWASHKGAADESTSRSRLLKGALEDIVVMQRFPHRVKDENRIFVSRGPMKEQDEQDEDLRNQLRLGLQEMVPKKGEQDEGDKDLRTWPLLEFRERLPRKRGKALNVFQQSDVSEIFSGRRTQASSDYDFRQFDMGRNAPREKGVRDNDQDQHRPTALGKLPRKRSELVFEDAPPNVHQGLTCPGNEGRPRKKPAPQSDAEGSVY